MSSNKGNLYLLPLPISDAKEMHIPPINGALLTDISYYIVERIRTARRFIRRSNPAVIIDHLEFLEIDKHNRKQDFKSFLDHANKGHNIGLMSEAGVPAVADPGARVVRQAHRMGITVIPLVGPSSIVLALMASGMNGQDFCFDGYLPRDRRDLEQKLGRIQHNIQRTGKTHIFIEAPYRNNRLMETILQAVDHNVRFCVACDILSENAYVYAAPIRDWIKLDRPDLHKRPTIFLLGN